MTDIYICTGFAGVYGICPPFSRKLPPSSFLSFFTSLPQQCQRCKIDWLAAFKKGTEGGGRLESSLCRVLDALPLGIPLPLCGCCLLSYLDLYALSYVLAIHLHPQPADRGVVVASLSLCRAVGHMVLSRRKRGCFCVQVKETEGIIVTRRGRGGEGERGRGGESRPFDWCEVSQGKALSPSVLRPMRRVPPLHHPGR